MGINWYRLVSQTEYKHVVVGQQAPRKKQTKNLIANKTRKSNSFAFSVERNFALAA